MAAQEEDAISANGAPALVIGTGDPGAPTHLQSMWFPYPGALQVGSP